MRVAEGCGKPSDGALSADLTCGDPRLGTGRKLVILPGLNHITILTASATHRQILDWLHDGLDAGITTDTISANQRFLWLLLGLGAAFLALLPALALASAGLRQLPARRAELELGRLPRVAQTWIADDLDPRVLRKPSREFERRRRLATDAQL